MTEWNTLYNFRPVVPLGDNGSQLYRSSSADMTDETTVKWLKLEKKIKTIIDLRNSSEIRLSPRSPVSTYYTDCRVKQPIRPGKRGVDLVYRRYFISFFGITQYIYLFLHLSIIQMFWVLFYLLRHLFLNDYGHEKYACEAFVGYGELQKVYIFTLENSTENIKSVFDLLKDRSNYPILISCLFGKDRTGVISAIILDLLGYNREIIIQSFTESEKQLAPIKEFVVKYFLTVGMPTKFAEASPNTILAFFDHLDTKYGSTHMFLRHIGLSDNDIATIKSNILSTEAE